MHGGPEDDTLLINDLALAQNEQYEGIAKAHNGISEASQILDQALANYPRLLLRPVLPKEDIHCAKLLLICCLKGSRATSGVVLEATICQHGHRLIFC